MELKGFTKLNEATAPELLKDEELTKLEDCVLDEKLGRPCKRGGWERVGNYADVTSNISSLHEVVTSNGDNYLLTGINGKIMKSLNGTGAYSQVTDKGTPPYRMQAYADKFVFTDGLVSPFIVSGDALTETSDLQITAPDITSVETGLCLTAGGSLEGNKTYKWIIVYGTATGEVSPPSIPITSHYLQYPLASTTTTATYKRVGFKNLPVSADSRVTVRNIYRTMGNGDVFYFHSQINNVITDWIDETADSYLGSEEFKFINIPQTAKYVSLHKERIVFGNLTRLVKNWIMPAYSNAATGTFDATFGENTYTFTGNVDFDTGCQGIKNCRATTGGTLTAGDYTYRFVFYDKDGLMSDPMDTNTVTVDGSTNQSVVIYTPPQMSATYDVIARAEIYRKKDSGDFELVNTYNPQIIALQQAYPSVYGWTDDGWTATTTYATNQVTETEKCGVAFSEIGNPATYVLENIRNIFPDDGDQITGIYDDNDGILIFKENSVCKIWTGSGSPDNWRVTRVLTNIGCTEPNALLKYGNTYVFVSKGEIYKFTSGGAYENIGIEIWGTLDTVTTWHCSTADDGWYIFGVSSTGLTKGYGFLVYDYIVGTWYLFNISSIPYVAKIREHGTNSGDFLTSQGTYVVKYGDGTVDSETGSSVDIVPIIRTKTFGEQIALVRLRKLKFNYKKMDNETLTITITNPDTGVTNTYTDTTNSANTSDFKLYESPVKATDSLKETPKFYVNFTGAGFVEWGDFKLVLKPILKGMRENG